MGGFQAPQRFKARCCRYLSGSLRPPREALGGARRRLQGGAAEIWAKSPGELKKRRGAVILTGGVAMRFSRRKTTRESACRAARAALQGKSARHKASSAQRYRAQWPIALRGVHAVALV